jgi:hypothetical protein
MRWTYIVMLVFIVAIVAHNFVVASSLDEPVPWIDLIAGIGFMLIATAFLWSSRRWFNFIAGEELCRWRAK